MPEANIKGGQAPDIIWKDTQYSFDGEWMPDIDPALIGPRNFASIENLRYNDRSIEGVNGYTTINEDYVIDGGDVVGAGGTYIKIRNGHQFRSNKSIKSYMLVNSADDVHASRVYNYTDAFAVKGEFEDAENLDVTGKPTAKVPYITDSAIGLTPSFSNAPQNSIVYCTGQDTKIFSGYEHRLASAFMCTDRDGTNIIDITEDLNNSLTTRTIILSANLVANGDCEAITNWNDVATPTITYQDATHVHSGSTAIKMVADAADDGIKSDAFTVETGKYWFTAWVYSTTDTTIDTKIYDGDDGLVMGSGDGADTEQPIVQNQWNKIVFDITFTAGASAAVEFRGPSAGDWWIDDVSVVKDGEYNELHIMTTRPVQGFHFDIETANATASTLEVQYWNGTTFADVTDDDDDTAITGGTITLGQDGFYRFAHTNGNGAGDGSGQADFRHFQELYLYAYRITLSAGSAEISHMTCDPGFQTVQNVWDGVYRQPIQFQIWDDSETAFEDFTLHVNQSSDVNTPIGGQIDALTANDHVILMFEEQMAGIRFTMLGDLINKAAATISLWFWDGHEWIDLATSHDFKDETINDLETISFTKTGLLSWTPPVEEKKQTLFNSLGYAYKLVVSGTLTGTDSGEPEILIDLVVGVPALLNTSGLHESKPFNFSALYQNRLMLGGFSAGGEGNRMDFSVTNAPDVFNGSESSMDGTQSLYFGGVEPITCATQLYNRFGASVFSMLLVLKDTEVYLMVGNNPADFIIYPVSQTVGCPAPDTLATAEVGLEVGKGLTRNVAIWLSNYGPMMFDGAILSPLTGINNYFDPNEDEYIEWDAISRAKGWVDQTYKEYNLLLPSSSGQTTNNLWLVYDLLRKKWFKKDTGAASFPQCGWNVMDPDTGEQMIFGGIDTGYMVHLEKGTSWGAEYSDGSAGSGITQKVRVGDFFPSNNIWDETLIRKFKVLCKRITASNSTTDNILNVNYYSDSAESASAVTFQSSSSTSGIYVDFTNLDSDSDGTDDVSFANSSGATLSLGLGLNRIVRLISDMNEKGWAHSFEFETTTDDVNKGWQPIVWGLEYRIERKDYAASTTAVSAYAAEILSINSSNLNIDGSPVEIGYS